MFKRLRKFIRDLAGLDDPPHKIAMGLALGIFVGFVPIMGIQMAAVLPFTVLFRANKTAALGGVWITNPITVIPIYFVNYRVGLLFTPYQSLNWAYFDDLFDHITMSKFLKLGQDILVPLFVGGFVLGVVLAIPTYFIARRLVSRRRERKAAKRGEPGDKNAGQPAGPD